MQILAHFLSFFFSSQPSKKAVTHSGVLKASRPMTYLRGDLMVPVLKPATCSCVPRCSRRSTPQASPPWCATGCCCPCPTSPRERRWPWPCGASPVSSCRPPPPSGSLLCILTRFLTLTCLLMSFPTPTSLVPPVLTQASTVKIPESSLFFFYVFGCAKLGP